MAATIPPLVTGSQLWTRTLGSNPGGAESEAVERLRVAFQQFRSHAEAVASEISGDLREFTIHDIGHIDALWRAADALLGPNYPINPLEGFILGGCFLVHDLGMALSSVPNGIAELKQMPEWQYYARQNFLRLYETNPSDQDCMRPEIIDATVRDMLRVTHAKRAKTLVTEPLGSTSTFLLTDPDLREAFGHVIGQIAASHGDESESVRAHFPTTSNPPPFLPSEWTYDPLKLALILRCTDAIQIDQTRAPRLIMSLRKLSAASGLHWVAQNRLMQPILEGDSIRFTSSQPFDEQDASSWWQCYDLLTLAHRELRLADDLLAEARPSARLAAKRVLGMPEPADLAKYVPTSGWEPLNVTIYVSDTPSLVARLGGAALYGEGTWAPLRELVQNAHDALAAKDAFTNFRSNDAKITLRVTTEGEQQWLEVEDNGIGMSKRVLTQELLNFGSSYWRSGRAVDELGDLLGRGFSPIGEYGIGFFSSFMLGEEIEVLTRFYDSPVNETLLLKFARGLRGRPMLSVAPASRKRHVSGTVVRVRLKSDIVEGVLELESDGSRPRFLSRQSKLTSLDTFSSELFRRCFASVFPISFEYGKEAREIVPTRDYWTSCSSEMLLAATVDSPYPIFPQSKVRPLDPPIVIDTLSDDQNMPVMRGVLAGITRQVRHGQAGGLFVGPFRSGTVDGMLGAVQGKPTEMSRQRASHRLSSGVFAEWLAKQYQLALEWGEQVQDPLGLGVFFHVMGFDSSKLCTATADGRPVTLEVLKSQIRTASQIAAAPRSFDDNELHSIKHQLGDQCLAIGLPPKMAPVYARLVRSMGLAPSRGLEINIEELLLSEWPGGTFSTSEIDIIIREADGDWEIDWEDYDGPTFAVQYFERGESLSADPFSAEETL